MDLQIDPGLASIRTARLQLRPVAPGDLDFLVSVFTDPRVTRHRPDPRPDTPAEVAERLERDLAAWRDRGFGRWLAADGDGPVGTVGLSPRPDQGGLNLAYHLHPAAWGRGYAQEMAAAAVDAAFTRLGAPRVVALVRAANPASAQVVTRLGFALEGEIDLMGAPTRLFARNA